MNILKNRFKFIIFIILYFFAHTLWILLMKQNETLFVLVGDLFTVLASLFATFFLFSTYNQAPHTGKTFWLLLVIGTAFYCIGDLICLFLECILQKEVLFPGVQDIFYMQQPLLYLIALFYLFFTYKGYYKFITLVFDLLLLMIVNGTIGWVYFISPILSLQEMTPISILLSLAYPIIEMILIIIIIGIYVDFENSIVHRDLFLLFIGLLIQFFANTTYIVLFATNHYYSGHFVDAFHTLAILLIGITGIGRNTEIQNISSPKAKRWVNSRIHFLRPYIPYISVLILITIVMTKAAPFNVLHNSAFIAIIIVLTRQISYIKENNQLLLKFQQRKKALAINEERYKSLFEHHPDGVFSLDLQDRFVSCNKHWGDLVGIDSTQLIGKPFLDVIPDRHCQYVFLNHFTKAKNGSTERYELSFINKEGKSRILQFTNIPIYVKNEIVGIYGIGKDITENKENEEKIKQMSLHDSLTGLPNRILFSEIIQVALDDAERNQEKLAIMFLDLDRFKTINDTLGHDVGDELLKETAKRLKASLRKNDTVCRQGGDEFSILLKGINKLEDISVIANKILHALNKPYMINGNEIITTPSMGIAIYPIDGVTTSALLQKADFAMYAVKEHGRNHYRLYSEDDNHDYLKQYLLEQDLHQALTRNELKVYYQPQFDVQNERLIGVEALLRWQHPKLGKISPVEFIPIAEQTGLIIPIGEWVLRTACQQMKHWHLIGLPLKVAVNLSPRQFRQNNLIELVKEVLHTYGLEPKYLDLEITEGIAMEDIQASIQKLISLKSIGISISIDDFGTGYSSLSYLANYPVDTLKIAREFTQKIGQDSGNEAIISSIIALAHNLKLNVLAEGVEKSAQLQFLKERNCNQVQGFMFGKPMTAQELEEIFLIEKNSKS